MTTIKVGSDPEFFLQKGRHFVSAHELPFGTKHQPMKTLHGAVHIDGTAVECNVRPAETREEFVQNVANIILEMNDLVEALLPEELVSRVVLQVLVDAMRGLCVARE